MDYNAKNVLKNTIFKEICAMPVSRKDSTFAAAKKGK
jgi:hypothetical protein